MTRDTVLITWLLALAWAPTIFLAVTLHPPGRAHGYGCC
jgi:hypothetical protein